MDDVPFPQMAPMLEVTPLSPAALALVVELLPSPIALVDDEGFVVGASTTAVVLLGADVTEADLHLGAHLASLSATCTAGSRSQIQTEDGPHELVALDTLGSVAPPDDVVALAGAVAHDFNNLLGVIMNFATLAAATVPPGSAAASDLREVLAASRRAATIAQRLQELGEATPPGRFAEPC